MNTIELRSRDVTTTGLYMMRWKGKTGLIRVIGEPKTGWKVLKPNDKTVEVLFPDMPKDGRVPEDALLSEPLVVTVT